MTRYEFALLRYLPDPAAGEFANVGVVLLDVDNARLFARLSGKQKRISDFFGDMASNAYRAMVRQLERGLQAANDDLTQPQLFDASGPSLDLILRRLLSEDESCMVASPVMSGVEEDPERRIGELFEEFVTRYEVSSERRRRDEGDMKRDIDRQLLRTGLIHRIAPREIRSAHFQFNFQYGWQNGRLQVMEPISLDLLDPYDIRDKAAKWSGRLLSLSHGADFRFTALLAKPTSEQLAGAVDDAVAILRVAPNIRDVIVDEDITKAMDIIRQDTEPHA